MVIQPSATIESFDPVKTEDYTTVEGKKMYRPNTILCDGGDIVMLGKSKMVFSRFDGGLTLTNGATLVNNGMVVTDTATRIHNSTIDNRKAGEIFQGIGVKHAVFASDLSSSRSASSIALNNSAWWNTPWNKSDFKGKGFAKYGLSMSGNSLIENQGLFMQLSLARTNSQTAPLVNVGNGETYRATEVDNKLGSYESLFNSFGNSANGSTDIFPSESTWQAIRFGTVKEFRN